MAIVKNYTIDYWQDLLAQLASDLPIDRLNAWMRTESNGFPQALGSCYEVGIFQTDLQDGPKWGGSTATLHDNFCGGFCGKSRQRDLTDDEEQLQVTSGAAMIREYLADAQNRISSNGLTWSDDDTWCLVKLQHALPALRYMLDTAATNGNGSDWGSFRAWALGLDAAGVATAAKMTQATAHHYMTSPPDGAGPLVRFFDNAEKVGYIGTAGLTGGGGLSALGKAAIALGVLAFLIYYGGHHGLAV